MTYFLYPIVFIGGNDFFLNSYSLPWSPIKSSKCLSVIENLGVYPLFKLNYCNWFGSPIERSELLAIVITLVWISLFLVELMAIELWASVGLRDRCAFLLVFKPEFMIIEPLWWVLVAAVSGNDELIAKLSAKFLLIFIDWLWTLIALKLSIVKLSSYGTLIYELICEFLIEFIILVVG